MDILAEIMATRTLLQKDKNHIAIVGLIDDQGSVSPPVSQSHPRSEYRHKRLSLRFLTSCWVVLSSTKTWVIPLFKSLVTRAMH